jgi:hypothetical protein
MDLVIYYALQESKVYLLPSNYATLKRWVDLQTYVFSPPNYETAQPVKLMKPPVAGKLQHLHPLTFLRFKNGTLPRSFSFYSRFL